MPEPTGIRDIFVEANGLRHHLVARGAPGSPAVILLHGLTQQARVFDPLAAHLASRFHVYALDVRGRGESEWGPPDGYHIDAYADDLEAIRVALGLERFALVGTSMGGLIALLYNARSPGHVTHLVLNDIGPDIDPEGGARIARMLTTAPDAFPDLKAVVKYYREANAPVLGNRSDDEVLDYARWHVRRADTGLYAWKMDPAVRAAPPRLPSMPLWDAFAAITCPLLVIRGAQSDILSAETAAKMAAAKPGTRVVEIPGIGHAPSLAEPQSLAAIDAFLSA
jgi:pimeloyl-ACP methyl ester carboxylesterase